MKVKKTKMYFNVFNVVAAILLFCNTSFAQVTNLSDTIANQVKKLSDDLTLLKKIKITGYIMAQYQSADSAGINSFEGGNFAPNVNNRFMLREARIKFIYEGNLSQYVFQLDATEKGVSIKDMYAKFTEPWLKTVSLTIGQMNRPFGFEIGYTPTDRESPERGRMSQTIFVGERDLGAMLTLQAPKTSKLNFLKFQ